MTGIGMLGLEVGSKRASVCVGVKVVFDMC